MSFSESSRSSIKHREIILNALLKSGLLLAAVALIPAMILAVIYSKYYIAVINIFFTFIFLFISYFPGLSYRIKSLIILIIIYITSINVLITYGFLSGAIAWFFSLAPIAAILFGLKAAVLSLILNSATIFFIGYYLKNSSTGADLPFFNTSFHALTALGNYTLLNGAVSITAGALLNRLEKSENQYRLITDSMNEIIWTTDKDRKITYVSSSVHKELGKSPDFFIGKNLNDFISSEELSSAMNSILINKTKNSIIETAFKRFDREIIYLEISLGIMTDASGVFNGFIGVIRNITEKKNILEQLEKSKKMEAVGQLAGGVAHDINNVLTGIVAYPDLIMMEISKEHRIYPYVNEIKKSGEKAAEIVQDLLIMTKLDNSKIESVYLNKVISEYFNSFSYRIFKDTFPDTEIVIKLASTNPVVKCSEPAIKKTINNLIKNSLESIKTNGQVTVKTETIKTEKIIYTRFKQILPGKYVLLTISDNGSGICENDIEHIFEPFYTKKVLKKSGTGLGMAVVWGTVNNCGGFIHVESKENYGTSIKIYFPETSIIPENNTEINQIIPEGDNEKILLVDDMQEQLEIGRKILEKLNYSVTTAKSGEEAVKYIQKEEYDLVILDMKMGNGMDGLDTYREIIKIYPEQKTAVLSGYSETERLKNLLNSGNIQFIKKPYTIEKIAGLVNSSLKKPGLDV